MYNLDKIYQAILKNNLNEVKMINVFNKNIENYEDILINNKIDQITALLLIRNPLKILDMQDIVNLKNNNPNDTTMNDVKSLIYLFFIILNNSIKNENEALLFLIWSQIIY